MHFDGTVTLGNVLTIAAFAVAALTYGIRTDLKVKAIQSWIAAHSICNATQISTLNKINESLSYLKGVSDAQKQRDGLTHLKDQY